MPSFTIFLLVSHLSAAEDVQGFSQQPDNLSTLAALLADRVRMTVFSAVTTKQSLVSQAVGSAAVAAGTDSIDRHFTLHSTHRGSYFSNDSKTSHNANQGTLKRSQQTAYQSNTQTSHTTNLEAVSKNAHGSQTDGLSTVTMSQAMISECVRDNTTLELKEADMVITYTLPSGTGSNSTLTHGPGTCWMKFTAAPDQVVLIPLDEYRVMYFFKRFQGCFPTCQMF